MILFPGMRGSPVLLAEWAPARLLVWCGAALITGLPAGQAVLRRPALGGGPGCRMTGLDGQRLRRVACFLQQGGQGAALPAEAFGSLLATGAQIHLQAPVLKPHPDKHGAEIGRVKLQREDAQRSGL
ncbi:hypothetical protein BGCPKDLD_2914 [Methylorubrum suomiense]|uniref:Uncharacterized protein n=1 Tax=Methylorubrum suomiense TaxID=144191 RepID=A0ABQ4UZ20_9HYPH|nr:hypothetical protein [Methylobacterium sp. L1A1]GJE76322.1 hypothetical protein BGCPKDLD_2914 [Methylorubrum suomiense]